MKESDVQSQMTLLQSTFQTLVDTNTITSFRDLKIDLGANRWSVVCVKDGTSVCVTGNISEMNPSNFAVALMKQVNAEFN